MSLALRSSLGLFSKCMNAHNWDLNETGYTNLAAHVNQAMDAKYPRQTATLMATYHRERKFPSYVVDAMAKVFDEDIPHDLKKNGFDALIDNDIVDMIAEGEAPLHVFSHATTAALPDAAAIARQKEVNGIMARLHPQDGRFSERPGVAAEGAEADANANDKGEKSRRNYNRRVSYR